MKINSLFNQYIKESTLSFNQSILCIPLLIVILPIGFAFEFSISGNNFIDELVSGFQDPGTYIVTLLMFILINLHRVLKAKKLSFLVNDNLSATDKLSKMNTLNDKKYRKALYPSEGVDEERRMKVLNHLKNDKTFIRYKSMISALEEETVKASI